MKEDKNNGLTGIAFDFLYNIDTGFPKFKTS